MDEGGDYAATRTGIFVGKLRYSSPEQLGFLPAGQRIDGRAGAARSQSSEMLTGRPPFEATSPHQYILHHCRTPPSGARFVAHSAAAAAGARARFQARSQQALRNARESLKRSNPSRSRCRHPIPITRCDSRRRREQPSASRPRKTDFVQKPTVRTEIAKTPRKTPASDHHRGAAARVRRVRDGHFRSQPAAVVTNLPKSLRIRPRRSRLTTAVDVTLPSALVAAPVPEPAPQPQPTPARSQFRT
jgi:serine/threonine protein kinase